MWFEGTVSDAITTADVEKKLLLVFIEGKTGIVSLFVFTPLSLHSTIPPFYHSTIPGEDDISKQARETLENFSSMIKQHAMCLKLAAGSEGCNTFTEIYPVHVTPSVVILNEGCAAQTLSGELDPEQLISELEKVSGKETIDDGEKDKKGDPSVPLEERISHVKAKIEEVRVKKTKEEEEKQLEFERSRRETGREITKLRRMREEQEMKEAMEERKRDAQLEKDARARVLAQIAADREERKRRLEGAPKVEEVKKKEPVAMPKVDSDSTRIQFRFPDGKTLTEVFKSRDPLLKAKEFIDQQNTGFEKFSLSQTFPRKTFTDLELLQSFYDLSLAPASVLMVIPDRSAPVQNY